MKHPAIRPEDSERFLVQHPPAIEGMLMDIMNARAIVSLHVESGQDFILSSIVAVDTEHGHVMLEQGADQDFNRRLVEAGQVTCGTTHQQVYIEFTGRGLKPTQYGNETVFQVAMPKELLRLQRREAYRLATSVVNPVKCLINAGGHFLETVVIDISIGGIGILSYEGISLLKAGETYHGCRVEMPGAGTFAVSLNVCTLFDVALKNGRVTHRAGCRFIDLPPSVETEIQRYINRLERQRLSRYI